MSVFTWYLCNDDVGHEHKGEIVLPLRLFVNTAVLVGMKFMKVRNVFLFLFFPV